MLYNGLIVVDLVQDIDEAVIAALDAGHGRLVELLPKHPHHAHHRLLAGQEVLPRVQHHGRVGGGADGGCRVADNALEYPLQDVEQVREVNTCGFDRQPGDGLYSSGPHSPGGQQGRYSIGCGRGVMGG